jgi:hypothetical protein
MPKDASNRIEVIRAKVREERAALSEISRKVSADLKRLIKPAAHRLDDVEGFFLDRKILSEPRTAAALSRWLDNADRVLRQAIQHRKYVEGLVKKFGPDARIVAG